MTEGIARFDMAVGKLSDGILSVLSCLSDETKASVREVRLRSERPVTLVTEDGICFVGRGGRVSYLDPAFAYAPSAAELQKSFMGLCSNSVYAFQREINEGFLTCEGGHRVGICGKAVISDGKIVNVKDISSLSIRIAGEFKGCASSLVKLMGEGTSSLLICGPPSSGKTTMLRDLARQLSSGAGGSFRKTVIVDEREEIAACVSGVIANDIGVNCDVLSGYPKAEGILTALRALSPELIICDEICTREQARAVAEGMNSGVSFILSAHASAKEDLIKRPVLRALSENGQFDTIVFLDKSPGRISKIYKAEELYFEGCSGSNYFDIFNYGRKGYSRLSATQGVRA